MNHIKLGGQEITPKSLTGGIANCCPWPEHLEWRSLKKYWGDLPWGKIDETKQGKNGKK